jgi:hypothetical protein
MKKLSVLLLMVVSLGTYAQNHHDINIIVPEVAKLAIVQSGASPNFNMDFIAPTVAGDPIDNPAGNSDLWLNYSSIVTATGPDVVRRILVKVDKAVTGGVSFTTVAGTASGGKGTLGSGTAPVSLTITNTNFVTGIGSCYTETGVNKGRNITYYATIAPSSYADIRSGTKIYTVTYTLTDN